MSDIYILSDYGKLTKKDDTLAFYSSEGERTILFPYKVKNLLLVGNISISGQALRLLTRYKINTILLSSNGQFNCKISYGDSKNVFLRQKQYRILDNYEKSLSIVKSIVQGKIRNQISFMQRIKRKNNITDSQVEKTLFNMKHLISKVEVEKDISKIRGFEGRAAKLYFEVFAFNIYPEWAEFKTRSKNPPRSNVNAVLSFLYTLLAYWVESAIKTQGLDPCVGSLHAINYGREALVFDLLEEFRAPIADSLCCSLFNLSILNQNDFEITKFSNDNDDFPIDKADYDIENENEIAQNCESEKGVLLTKDGLKKVINAFEEKMDSLIFYKPTGEKISYKKIIYEQVLHYKRVINDEEIEYNPYYLK